VEHKALVAFAEDVRTWGSEHQARVEDELKAAEKIEKEK
jgi:hypothetical protein